MSFVSLRAITIAASVMLGATTAQAVPTTARYLAMDGSGSIDGGQFTMLIDVTTDGQWNEGTDPAIVTASVVPPLAAVNCLGIGAAADCSFVVGYGSDFGQVNFADLERALTSKITTEVIPEPATMLVLGVGIAGVGEAAHSMAMDGYPRRRPIRAARSGNATV